MGIVSQTIRKLGFKKPVTVEMRDPGPPVDFSARNQDGKTINLADYRGKYVLLYFYPKDDTEGCTKQACGLRDEMGDIKKLGAEVFGISRQGESAHRNFRNKFRLQFDLLVDDDG
ncbi:MAG: peroxiredoxin, partial [Bdellovibrionia bacterium]